MVFRDLQVALIPSYSCEIAHEKQQSNTNGNYYSSLYQVKQKTYNLLIINYND